MLEWSYYMKPEEPPDVLMFHGGSSPHQTLTEATRNSLERTSVSPWCSVLSLLWTRDKGGRDCQRNWLSNSNGDNWVLNTRPGRSLFPGAQIRSEWQPREPNPQRTMKVVCRMLLYFPMGKYMNCQHNQKKTRIDEQESGLLPTQSHILLPSFWI